MSKFLWGLIVFCLAENCYGFYSTISCEAQDAQSKYELKLHYKKYLRIFRDYHVNLQSRKNSSRLRDYLSGQKRRTLIDTTSPRANAIAEPEFVGMGAAIVSMKGGKKKYRFQIIEKPRLAVLMTEYARGRKMRELPFNTCSIKQQKEMD